MLLLYKWMLAACLMFTPSSKPLHPFYVSVVEMKQNPSTMNMEIMVKIFTDDFEITLRKHFPNQKVDLLNEKMYDQMLPLVEKYISNHLAITVNGQSAPYKLIGFEEEEEGIISYFETEKLPLAKQVRVKCDLLYDYKKEQTNIFHVIVQGVRKSHKLVNPDELLLFNFYD